MKLILVTLFCVWNYAAAELIEPCHASDRTCLKRSAQNAVALVAAGIPDLGMSPLDPMQVVHVSASQAGLDMEFTNTVVKGLRNCQVLDLRRLGSKTKLNLKCSVTLVGDYSLSGKLLVLDIEGEGRYKIKIRDIVVKVTLDIGVRQSGGERYWTVDSWTQSSDVLGGATFQFQNLFNGDKDLADPVITFANENWHEIFQEVAPPIVEAIVSQVVTETSKLFDQIPIRELALE